MTNQPPARPLPGDLPTDAAVHRMIRVDHAGEYGAARIYAGQLAVLGRSASADQLRHMQDQEQVHLDTFNAVIADRRVRPTALLPFWHLAGFALGAATAALGQRAAMACTVAVEETIDKHYTAQIDRLPGSEAPLRDTLTKFRAEEREHRDIALANDAEQAPGYRLLSAAIRTGCRIAIRLSERL
jgi:ubiquinone biosynthesis monooxygenase Coq7